MTTSGRRFLAAGLLVAAIGAAAVPARAGGQQSDAAPDPKPRPDLVRQPYSQADVDFMAGMIPHHAQAVLIAGWAQSHGARRDVRTLCERIVVGQRDEIAFMRNWLRDRGQTVPDGERDAPSHEDERRRARHADARHAQRRRISRELDKARGAEWDRLFLAAMIRHHEGAIKMVDDLFKSHGALQDEDVYKFASDIYADQTTEIERMQKMLTGMEKGVPQ